MSSPISAFCVKTMRPSWSTTHTRWRHLQIGKLSKGRLFFHNIIERGETCMLLSIVGRYRMHRFNVIQSLNKHGTLTVRRIELKLKPSPFFWCVVRVVRRRPPRPPRHLSLPQLRPPRLRAVQSRLWCQVQVFCGRKEWNARGWKAFKKFWDI